MENPPSQYQLLRTNYSVHMYVSKPPTLRLKCGLSELLAFLSELRAVWFVT